MKIIVVLAFSIISVFLNAKTVIHVGNLFDVKSGNLLPEMSLFVENEFITEVVEGYVPPDPEDIYIDLTGYYAFPGLIDMHVHLTSQSSNRAYLENFTLNAADYAIRATKNAEKTLLAGFTTVRNLGDFDSVGKARKRRLWQISMEFTFLSPGRHAAPIPFVALLPPSGRPPVALLLSHQTRK